MHCHSNELEIQQSAKVLIDLQSTCNMIVRQDNVNRTQPFARKPTSDTVITLTMHHPAEDSALPHLPSPSLFALNEMVTQNFSFTSDSSTAYTDNNSSSNDTSFESPLTKRRKTASLYRSSSLDRGKDTYTDWTGKQFELSAAISKETDTQDISQLWKLVNMPSGKDKNVESEASRPHYARGTQSSVAKSTASTANSSKLKRPSPYDKDFSSRVLEPRRITIYTKGPTIESHVHFKVPDPTGNRHEYYTSKKGATDSKVWLENDEAFIAEVVEEYLCMLQSAFCEAEYASYATENLFKRDRRVVNLAKDRCWKTERVIQLVAKTTDDKYEVWLAPPVIGGKAADDTSYTDYEFDLRPDCSYWLSLQAFSEESMGQLDRHAHVMKERMTCPYLTIEFKKDDSSDLVARGQVAAAAALALYNRFRLRDEGLQSSRKQWNSERVKVLRHYGITLQASAYIIWVVEPNLTSKFAWNGCTMSWLFGDNCKRPFGVRQLINWINEIHCWGLTVHGPMCEKDLKRCIVGNQGSYRLSDIVPSAEDSS